MINKKNYIPPKVKIMQIQIGGALLQLSDVEQSENFDADAKKSSGFFYDEKQEDDDEWVNE